MRSFVFAVVFAAVLFLFAAPGFCQGGQGMGFNLGLGSMNGPTVEIRSNQWLVQGTWNMYYLNDNGFDAGWVARADYVWKMGGGKAPIGYGKQSPAELAFGYTYINIDDNLGNNFTENGANLQYIYYVQQGISLNVGYDYFFNPDPGSIQSLVSVGAMYHF